VVAVTVQSAFRLEIYQDDVFSFFKNYFSKRSKNIKNILILSKKKFEFFNVFG